MTLTEQFKSKSDALKSVLAYCEELKKLRQVGLSNINEIEEIEKYINNQIQSYKDLVKELNEEKNN